MNDHEIMDGCETAGRVLGLLRFMWGGVPAVFELRGATAADDFGVFDLGTPQGRAAWKAAAPDGAERIVIEDGERWAREVLGELCGMVLSHMDGCTL